VTAELVHVSAKDWIIATSLRTHSTVVVHIRRRMVLQVTLEKTKTKRKK
jgi:hypothetical protein